MYKELVKIYIGDLQNETLQELSEEVQNRLEFINEKHNVVDDVYLDILKAEMTTFSDFTTIEKDYITYNEETSSDIDNEPWLLFTKEDLQEYTDYLQSKGIKDIIKFNYIER